MEDLQKKAFAKLRDDLIEKMKEGHIEDVGIILGILCLAVVNILDYLVKKE